MSPRFACFAGELVELKTVADVEALETRAAATADGRFSSLTVFESRGETMARCPHKLLVCSAPASGVARRLTLRTALESLASDGATGFEEVAAQIQRQQDPSPADASKVWASYWKLLLRQTGEASPSSRERAAYARATLTAPYVRINGKMLPVEEIEPPPVAEARSLLARLHAASGDRQWRELLAPLAARYDDALARRSWANDLPELIAELKEITNRSLGS